MAKKETILKSKCKKWYETTFNNFVIAPEQYIHSGDPDLIMCHNGFFIAVELKVKGGKPTPLQEIKINKIKKSGGRGYIVYSFQEFKDIFKDL